MECIRNKYTRNLVVPTREFYQCYLFLTPRFYKEQLVLLEILEIQFFFVGESRANSMVFLSGGVVYLN